MVVSAGTKGLALVNPNHLWCNEGVAQPSATIETQTEPHHKIPKRVMTREDC